MLEQGTLFGRLANRAAFVIANEHIYQVGKPTQKGSSIHIGNLRFALTASSTLAQLETFEYDRSAQEIATFKENYLKNTYDTKTLFGEKQKEYQNKAQALEFIVFEAFPRMIDSAIELQQIGIQLGIDTTNGASG